jgi:hypothetical protein
VNLIGCLHGLFCQLSDLIGNDCKPPSCINGPSSLNGGIQSQKIGLIGDIRNNIRYPANIVNLLA